MDSRLQHHVYRFVKIERGIEAVPIDNFEFSDYADAWNFCVTIFVYEKRVSAMLIYSTRGTGIFLKRTGVGMADSIEKREEKMRKSGL